MMPIDFEKQIYPLKDKLYRFSLSIVGNIKDAEDAVQDTFFKIWNKRAQLDAIENIEAWSMSVIRNLSLDKLKRKGRLYAEIDSAYHVKSDKINADQQMEQLDHVTKLKTIIESLPEKQKAMISLRDIEGYSYQEISKILSLSMSEVKVGIHRGRKFIQKELLKIDQYGIS